MTDDELKGIEARVDAATPGPWEHDDIDPYRVQDTGRGNMICRTMSNEPNPRGQWLDADFIAHAREDIQALIAEIRRLKK